MTVVANGIEYARPDGRPLLLDLYRPEPGTGPVPVVLFAHGGGWAHGDRAMVEPLAGALVAHGLAVAGIDYRLGEAGRYPNAIADVRAAVRFLRAEGGRWDLATDRIGAWGASAGGHLVLMAALADDPPRAADGTDRIDAVIDWFGVTDLLSLGRRSPLEGTLLGPAGPEAAFLGLGAVTDDPGLARRAGPLWHVHPDGPPTLIMHGDADKMVGLEQSRRLHDALSAAGVNSTLVVIGGAGHEDPAFGRPELMALMAAFLTDHLTDHLTDRPSGPGGSAA